MNELSESKNPVGRPSSYSQEVADELCSYLAEGMSLSRACEQAEHLPTARTVFSWLRTNEEFLQNYTRAKQESADAMAEELLDIADDGSNDWMEDKYMKGKTPGWAVNGEALQRSKLRVDTRKWLMSKMKPKKYSEKLDVTTDGKELPSPIYGGVSAKRD